MELTTVPVKAPLPPDDVVIRLTHDEAQELHRVLGPLPARGINHRIYNALTAHFYKTF